MQDRPFTPNSGVSFYSGVFLIAAVIIAMQTMQSRIFSVTTWYHLSFLAISVAMFGMTLGALVQAPLPGDWLLSQPIASYAMRPLPRRAAPREAETGAAQAACYATGVSCVKLDTILNGSAAKTKPRTR